jgi:hypothetical protein
MRNIQAEACIGQVREDALDLVRDASGALAVIHVLRHKPRSEVTVDPELRKCIRMSHDRSHPQRHLGQQLYERSLRSPVMGSDSPGFVEVFVP